MLTVKCVVKDCPVSKCVHSPVGVIYDQAVPGNECHGGAGGFAWNHSLEFPSRDTLALFTLAINMRLTCVLGNWTALVGEVTFDIKKVV